MSLSEHINFYVTNNGCGFLSIIITLESQVKRLTKWASDLCVPSIPFRTTITYTSDNHDCMFVNNLDSLTKYWYSIEIYTDYIYVWTWSIFCSVCCLKWFAICVTSKEANRKWLEHCYLICFQLRILTLVTISIFKIFLFCCFVVLKIFKFLSVEK